MKYIYTFDSIVCFDSNSMLYIDDIEEDTSDLSFESENSSRIILEDYPVSVLKLILHDFRKFLISDEYSVFDLTKYSK